MRCEVRQFRPEDAEEINLQPGQAQTEYHGISNREVWEQISKHGHSFTAMRDGKILGAVGLMPQWPGLAIAWSLLSDKIGAGDMVWITKRVVAFLDAIQAGPGYRRIQMATATGFPAASRWARILGFEQESVLRAYGHDGRDFLMYVRIRPEIK